MLNAVVLAHPGCASYSTHPSQRTGLDTVVQSSTRNYSVVVRNALTICAVLLTLLPVPVTLLGLLPAYRSHARFLVFYAPLICVLTLGYLFYLRDVLARVLFAQFMRPSDDLDPYYRQTFSGWASHTLARARSVIVTCLPALLMLTSYYCVTRYATRLNDSVLLASDMYRLQFAQQRITLVDSAADSATTSARPAPGKEDKSAMVTAPPFNPADLPRVREYALRSAGIADIPYFTELTALYLGAFVAALAAVITMSLKEYAKEAMGLTETELVLGRLSTDPW
jgi:hypothetical protein